MENGILDQGLCELHAGPLASHPKSIIHIDIDCFYAQVEMITNPNLRSVPLGIQQKNIIVTSNYIAREYGIKKCMLLDHGLKLCPQLVLINGEDLMKYRKMSQEIFNFLQTFGCPVERLGMDENFMDVSKLIKDKMSHDLICPKEVSGHLFGTGEALCPCSCKHRLIYASQLAQEIRCQLMAELGITSCAGIAHNKLLAKIVGTLHKPNQQTTIFPENATLLMSTLQSVRQIPGVGTKAAEVLSELNINSVADLQKAEFSNLSQALGTDAAMNLKNLGIGVDISEVKQSIKPQSIGLEDTFKVINNKNDAMDKINNLLTKLICCVLEDGRTPLSLRLTIRKPDVKQNYGIRLTRQTQISPTLFVRKSNGSLSPATNAKDRLLNTCTQLLCSVIDVTDPFHLTLLGITFSKFQENNNYGAVKDLPKMEYH